MAEQLKPPKKGILKNSTSFDKTERKSSLKETKWDEMNIIATFHPADKDYGHMKIEEPKTPYNYACPDEAAEAAENIDSDVLAQKIRLGADQPPKAMEQVDEDEEEENMTDEQRGGPGFERPFPWTVSEEVSMQYPFYLAVSSRCRYHRHRRFVRRRHLRCCCRRLPLNRPLTPAERAAITAKRHVGPPANAAQPSAGPATNAAQLPAGPAANAAQPPAGPVANATQSSAGPPANAARPSAGPAANAAQSSAGPAANAAQPSAGPAANAAQSSAGQPAIAAQPSAGPVANAAQPSAGPPANAAQPPATAAASAPLGGAGRFGAVYV